MHAKRNAWVLLMAALFWLGPAFWASPDTAQRSDTAVESSAADLGSFNWGAWLTALWQSIAGAEEDPETSAQGSEEGDSSKDDEPGPGGPTQEIGPWIVPIG